MRLRSPLSIAYAALLIVALLVWIRSARLLHRSESLVAILAQQRAGLKAEVERLEGRVANANRAQADLRQALASAGTVKPPSFMPAAAPTNAPVQRPQTMSELVASDPKLEVLYLNRQRAVVMVEYGDFFRARGLSPEQIDKFTDNYVKHIERTMDLGAAARGQDAAGQQTVTSLQQQERANYELAQSAVLGADGYQQMEEYLRTLPLQNIVMKGFAGAAALAGISLTAQQGEQLFQAAIDASGRDPKLGGEQLARVIDWDALDARARQILSPEQFALFTTVAPPSGFQSRWKYRLDAAILQAQQADSAKTAAPAAKPPGG